MLQSFKQTLTQELKKNLYSQESDKDYLESLNSQDFHWDNNIQGYLKPNGPTLCIYLGVDTISCEGTPNEIPPEYYLGCFADPDLEFTFNGQRILVTIDN